MGFRRDLHNNRTLKMQPGEPWSSPNHSRTTWGKINLVWDGFGRTPVGVALHFSQAASLILGSICCRLLKNWLSRESWWSTWRLRLLTNILWPLHTIWQGCVHIWMFCICRIILWLKACSYSHDPVRGQTAALAQHGRWRQAAGKVC